MQLSLTVTVLTIMTFNKINLSFDKLQILGKMTIQ